MTQLYVRQEVEARLRAALFDAQESGALPDAAVEDLAVERPQDSSHGDFATSIALKLARQMRMNPREIASRLAERLDSDGFLQGAEVAGPGFVNVRVSSAWLASCVEAIRAAGSEFGNAPRPTGERVQVEFVSVNPTGPIHVGHARGAVFGDTLASILSAAGHEVEREYYFNDAGTQMEAFARSLLARYRQHFGVDCQVPEDGYHGEYVIPLAERVASEHGRRFMDMPEHEAAGELLEIGLAAMVQDIRDNMARLGIEFDVWFTERSLYENGQYDTAMSILRESGFVAERDGAVWFTSTDLGEDKDNVLVRSSGAPTYFATDVAYHYNKLVERGFNKVVDVWGADHQGHVPRMKAVARAMGIDADRLVIAVTQMVSFKREGEVVRIAKRTGDLITLRELLDEVGPDACRFVFLSRSAESQMEFDLELAVRQSSENPVYYVQYAHARIASILRLAAERGIDWSDGDVNLLSDESELELIRKMLVLPELIQMMAGRLEPHHLPHYSMELATAFHLFYQKCRVVSSAPEDLPITKGRLKLVDAARVALSRSLSLMSMSAPDTM